LFDGNLFDLNKQMAFKYYQYAMWEKDTEIEASLKIADFLHYGTSGHKDLEQSVSIYKLVENQTKDAEIIGHANF
jgi:hypothetical protein